MRRFALLGGLWSGVSVRMHIGGRRMTAPPAERARWPADPGPRALT